MTNGDWIYWLGWLAIIAIYVVLIYVACWALYGEKAKGRRRCPKCWYDLSYSEAMRCSECGFVAQDEKQLARRRPRYVYAGAAIAACVGIALYVGDLITQRGWASIMPTKALILLLPVVDTSTSPLFAELGGRMNGRRLSDREWEMLFDRCVKGDWSARPVSDEWANKYGMMIQQYRAGFPPDAKATNSLLALPPRIRLSTRSTWPIDVPITVDVQADDWWPDGTAFRIHATPLIEGATTDTHLRLDGPIQPRSYSIPVPPPDPAAMRVDIELRYERRPPGQTAWEPTSEEIISVATTFDRPLSEHMTPVSSEEMTRVMRGVFNSGVVKYTEGGSLPVRINVQANHTFTELFEGVGVGITVEVRHDGDLGRKLNIWWVAGPDLGIDERSYAWEVPTSDERVLAESDPNDGKWTMHVRSNPSLALLLENVDKYWEGEFTVAAKVRTMDREAPDRGWRPDHIVDYAGE